MNLFYTAIFRQHLPTSLDPSETPCSKGFEAREVTAEHLPVTSL